MKKSTSRLDKKERQMPHFCGVVGCSHNSMKDVAFKYFRIPSEKGNRGLVVPEKQRRRSQWIKSLHRADLTESKIKNMRICSAHFIRGKPAEYGDTTNPDYVPHLNMGYETEESSVARYARYARLAVRNHNLQKASTLQKIQATKTKRKDLGDSGEKTLEETGKCQDSSRKRKYEISSDLLPMTTIKIKTELNTEANDEIITVTLNSLSFF